MRMRQEFVGSVSFRLDRSHIWNAVWPKKQRDHVAASCGISCGETSQARPIHYRILGLILPSLSLFHLNRTDKLFLSLQRSSAASYLVSVPPVCCLSMKHRVGLEEISAHRRPGILWFSGKFGVGYCRRKLSNGSKAPNLVLFASHRENDKRRTAGEKMAAGSKRLCRRTEMETPASGATTSVPLLQVQTSIFPSLRGCSPNKRHSFSTCRAAFVCYTTCDHTHLFFLLVPPRNGNPL